jgi:hypothetical protein
LPIRKPVSLKLYISSSQIPYLASVRATSLNQAWITWGSSQRALWRLYGQLNGVLRLSVRLRKFFGQSLPTWPARHSASSLSAISHTAPRVGENPRVSRLIIYSVITSSSSLLSFFKLGSQSRRAAIPARRRCTVVRGQSKIEAARFTLSKLS